MEKLKIEKLFDFYIDTLEKCGMDILDLSNEMIGYYIFEELDIGATTFLYKDNVNRLLDEGFIDDDIYAKSILLREKIMRLQGTKLWNIESVKNTSEWKEILQLSDDIKQLIYQRWTDAER